MNARAPQSTMSTTDHESVVADVEASLSRIRRHPFIQAAGRGSLTRAQAERWIKCAGRESRSFPTIIENMIEFTSNSTVRRILNENLADEYGNGNIEHAHFNHYLHLLDNLNISRADFYDYQEGPGIQLALSLAYNVSKASNPGLALGYMLVNEGMTPITYDAVRAALLLYYPNLKTTFFDMHIEVDAHHVEELYRAVAHMQHADLEQIRFGILIGERGMAVLLDEAYGVFDYVKELPVHVAA